MKQCVRKGFNYTVYAVTHYLTFVAFVSRVSFKNYSNETRV